MPKVRKPIAQEAFEMTGHDPLPGIALAIKLKVLQVDRFGSRKRSPDANICAGQMDGTTGVPSEMVAVLFPISRASPRTARWQETPREPGGNVAGPRQLQAGARGRKFIAMEKPREEGRSERRIAPIRKGSILQPAVPVARLGHPNAS